MSDIEPSDVPSADLEATDAIPADTGSAGAGGERPKRPLITVSRVIVFGFFFAVIFMFIQDRLASSQWAEAHEWIKAEMKNAGRSGLPRSDVQKHILEQYELYPEDHLTLPTFEYYHWPTWVRVFTIKVQFASTQIVQAHVREIRYKWMEYGEIVEENQEKSAVDPKNAPSPMQGLPGGSVQGPPGN